MFVHYFTHVPVELGLVQSRIDAVRSSLEEWAGVAYREGEELHARVGPAELTYAKEVRLGIGPGEVRPAGIVYPVTWTAVGAEVLFPRLDADLILTHLGWGRTKLTLEGNYAPPMGPVGRVIDRIILKNIAESTVQDWVDRVAMAVRTEPEVRGGALSS
jgi:hypothetical protein